jgi:hypothetical protein
MKLAQQIIEGHSARAGRAHPLCIQVYEAEFFEGLPMAQDFPNILQNLNVDYHVHKSPPLVHIQSI